MTKFLIPLAAAVSTVAIAAPASAQWSQQPYAYGQHNPYQQPYGYAYGYRAQAQAMQARINRIQRDIRHLAQRRMISRSEYRNLNQASAEIERRFRHNARDGRGLTQREMYGVEVRLQRLEAKIARDVRDGRQWGYRW